MGTIRAVPMRHGLTLAEKLLGQALPDAGSMLDDSWEMGRLVLDPDFRAGPELLRRCLFMGLSFLHNQARVVNLHAACTPTLARLYRRFGFAVVARDVPLAGTEKSYTLIHGPFLNVLDALSAADDASDDSLAAGIGWSQQIPQGAFA